MKRALLLGLLLAGCRPLPAGPDYDEFEVTWRLVDLRVEDPAGDASVAPDPVLTLEPDVARPAVVTRLLDEDAGVGQTAVMEVRVIGVRRRVRVQLRPSRAGVRVVGPDCFDVEGDRPFTVTFTCDSPGRASLVPVVLDPPASR